MADKTNAPLLSRVGVDSQLLHGSQCKSPSAAAGPATLSRAETLHIIREVRTQLGRCVKDVEQIEREYASGNGRPEGEPVAVSTITIRVLAACLSELLKLERPQDHREYCPDLCQLLDCPQQPVLRWAVRSITQRLKAEIRICVLLLFAEPVWRRLFSAVFIPGTSLYPVNGCPKDWAGGRMR